MERWMEELEMCCVSFLEIAIKKNWQNTDLQGSADFEDLRARL
jgi:hypothetical protein